MSTSNAKQFGAMRGSRRVAGGLLAATVAVSLLQAVPSNAEAKPAAPPSVKQDKPVKTQRVAGADDARLAIPAEKAERRAKWPATTDGDTVTPSNGWTKTDTDLSVRAAEPGGAELPVTVTAEGKNNDLRGPVYTLELPKSEASAAAPSPTPPAEQESADDQDSAPSAQPPAPDLEPTPAPTAAPRAAAAGPDDAEIAAAPLLVSLNYEDFATAYGGDWANRLKLVLVNDCEPSDRQCDPTTDLKTTNNTEKHTLTATVPASAMRTGSASIAATAAAGGNAGNFAATSLSPSSSWAAGSQSGNFTWSYPIDTPPGVGGPSPDLALSYDSGTVDGKIASSNNQASWVGEGFDLEPGFVERSYIPCRDVDVEGKDDVASGDEETGDLCFRNDNLTLSFGSHSGKLIRQDGTDDWRLQNDDGTRIKHVAGGAGFNADNDGEYWVITTTDGTDYYFGRSKRLNAGLVDADSVSTVGVYGSKSGQPCHGSSFASSWCQQAWRWQLDYVVDPHGNSMSLFYEQATNKYGANDGASDRTYDRAATLKRIEYGTRTDSESNPPARVLFTSGGRCTGGGECPSATDEPTRWPDVPTDKICTTTCDSEQETPTFFSTRRLEQITTQTRPLDGSWGDTATWDLSYSYRKPADGTSQILWLDSIQKTGNVGGTTVLPAVAFAPVWLDNRVDRVGDSADPFIRPRLSIIDNGVDGKTTVTYDTDGLCTPATKPTKDELSTNDTRCFPSYYQPDGYDEPRLELWHKHRVKSVKETDGQGGSAGTYVEYSYSGNKGWHYTTDDIQIPKYRTYNEWRGFAEVTTMTGSPSATTPTYSKTFYLRGMGGDVQDSGNLSPTITDANEYQGFARLTVRRDGVGGDIIDYTVSSPWRSEVTATNSQDEKSYIVATASSTTNTKLSSGGYRTTKTETDFDQDGLPTSVADLADTSTTADDRCTRTSYKQNRGDWMLDYPSTVVTAVGTCATANEPDSADDVISASRTYYDDESTLTKGDPTRVQSAAGWTGGTIDWQTDATSTFDSYGRAKVVKDAHDAPTTTSYSPSTGIPTSVVTTNALNQTSTTTLNRSWGTTESSTDVSGATSFYDYDSVGRVRKAWAPGRAKSETPSYEYEYRLRYTEASSVTTKRLNADGNYISTVQLYDSLLRDRSTQSKSPSPNGGWLITEKLYDTKGQLYSDRGPYWTVNDPQGLLVRGQENQYPSYTNYDYDGVGRVTKETFLSMAAVKWSTSTSYGGDRVSVIPPAGGTRTTTINDARGQTTELQQMPLTGGTPQSTTYTYTKAGQLKTMASAGSTWSRAYDIRGRLVTENDPDKGQSTYTYDALDRKVTSTDARGEKLWTKYDQLGRKVELRDDTSAGALRASWEFDGVKPGLLSSATRVDAGKSYVTTVDAYDDASRPTKSTVNLPSSETGLYRASGYVTSTEYNIDGSVKSQLQPVISGLTTERLTYGYDNLGNLDTLGASGSVISDSVYTAYGQLAQRTMGATLGKSIYDNREYDEATGRLTRHWASLQGTATTPQIDLRYGYDDSGNVTKMDDVAGTAMRQCFKYDYLRRVTQAYTTTSTTCASASTSTVGSQNPYWNTYSYDASGTRTSVKAVTGTGSSQKTVTSTYASAAANKPKHSIASVSQNTSPATVESFDYDAAGNMKSRTTSSTVGQTITWDAEGRQDVVTLKDGSKTDYVYDADGNRLLKRESKSGSTTLYLAGAEITATGSTVKGVRHFTVDGEPIGMRDAGGQKITIADHHNSSLLSINSSTLAVTKRRLDPFGLPLLTAAWPSTRGFVNQPADTTTGTAHLGAREYDSTLGRFLSVDPLLDTGDPQQANGYSYANNSPLTFTDPDGLAPLCTDTGRAQCDRDVIANGGGGRGGKNYADPGGAGGGNSPSATSPVGQRIPVKWDSAPVAVAPVPDPQLFNGPDRYRVVAVGWAVMMVPPAGAVDSAAKRRMWLEGHGYCFDPSLGCAASGAANLLGIGKLAQLAHGLRAAEKAPELAKTQRVLTTSERRAVTNLEKRAQEHRQKLAMYRADPDSMDNKGHLARAGGDQVLRQKIIDGRVRHLEHEIAEFEGQANKIRRGDS